jgi:hypothetical protein
MMEIRINAAPHKGIKVLTELRDVAHEKSFLQNTEKEAGNK